MKMAGSLTPDFITRMNGSLRQALDKIEATPNTFTVTQFMRYKPLFMKDRSISPEEERKLKKEYFSKVDPYKETIIVDDMTGEVVKTLPQELVPFVLPTGQKYAELSAINSKAAASIDSDDPYAQKAFLDLALSFIKEQEKNINTIKQASIRYTEVMDEFHGIRRDKEESEETQKTENSIDWSWGD